MSASSLRWPLLALLGLLVAAAVAFLATRAVNTDIGISSEPPTAGQALSPAPAKRARPRPTVTTTTTVTTSPPVTTSAPPTVTVPSTGGGGADGAERGDD
jgi:hypothetical protein